jgi:NAD(P)-dependent dehydrogenase (short-subunit alcohol dehydrogenase family)
LRVDERPFPDTLPEDLWDLLLDINLKAAWLMSRFAGPHLRRSQHTPSIVNAASVAGLVCPPRLDRRVSQ